jgi:hypothetical protein
MPLVTARILFAFLILSYFGSFLSATHPVAQSANGCTGLHCAYLPMASVAGSIGIVEASVTAFRAVCATWATAIIENTSDQVYSEVKIGMELVYDNHAPLTTTLTFSNGALLSGQRAQINGRAECIEGDRPDVGRVWLITATPDPESDYVALDVPSIQYDCSNRYTPVITLALHNPTASTVNGLRLFLHTSDGSAYIQAVATIESITAGGTEIVTYRDPYGYGTLHCMADPTDPTGPLLPPARAQAYAYGRTLP